MRLMTLGVGFAVLGCAGASGETPNQEQTDSNEQALASNVGHTFEQNLAWRSDTGKVTQVCTLSLLEPPQPLEIGVLQVVEEGLAPGGMAAVLWEGEATLTHEDIGRPKERVEITSNCPGLGCRVDIRVFMKGWLPDLRLGCQFIVLEGGGGPEVAFAYATGSALHATWPAPIYGRYAYRQKLLMNTQQTRQGHQCTLREYENPSEAGRVDSFDVLVAGASVFDGSTTIPIPFGPIVTDPHAVFGMQTSGQGTDAQARPFNLGKHSIYPDGTIVPGDYVQCMGSMYYDEVWDDFDVNVTTPPLGDGMVLWGSGRP